uniref:ubiquitinyl hydrolase 1 n=1 Tax=Amphora coffeiformis TaxID=265554 RepID=A0A6S8PAR9_9STRA
MKQVFGNQISIAEDFEKVLIYQKAIPAPSNRMSTAATEAPSSARPLAQDPSEQKDVLQVAADFKTEGNAAFSNEHYEAALEAYNAGLQALEQGQIADSDTALNLKIILLNNRAMVMLRMKNFQGAEASCSVILENLKCPHPKAYHRRAMARERLAETLQPEYQLQYFVAAKADLQAAMALLDAAENMDPNDKRKQQSAVVDAAKLLHQRLVTVQKARKEKEARRAAADEAAKAEAAAEKKARKPTPHVPRRPRRSPAVVVDGKPAAALRSPAQQRQDVLRLLLSRQTQIKDVSVEGEAFYIIDWYWWSDFCQHVDLFYKEEKDQQRQRAMVLRSLPLGAVVPGEEDGDDDSDDYDGPPGPIDNSALFLVPPTDTEESCQQAYYQQWYRIPASKQKEQAAVVQLLPNLVRGYDYEIIPREVYNALREWYGEVTPSICRRAVKVGTTLSVALYPQIYEAVPPLQAWNSNLYDRCGACRRPGVRLRCRRCMAIYYCNRGCQQSNWPFHKQYCQPIAQDEAPTFVAQSGGRVGLITLGNTCFMNSALQCLSHTAPLTRHFLSGRYSIDLNRDNPLGTGGKLADAYATVLQELWMRPGAKQVKPYALKRAIAVFAPRFAGTLQHDAQEFLAYLLDGLHEDLNRIRRAPYVEMPDFQDGQNMNVAGAMAWEAHMRRNDSLVLDTFYGQFKSTCVCPNCNKVSVSFDAFNHVSLEIPQNQSIVPLVVLVVRAAGKGGPVRPERFAIPFRKSNPLIDFKKELSERCGISLPRLHLCEIRQHEVVHIYNDNETAMGIRPSDMLVAYEAEAFNQPCFHVLVRHKTAASGESPSLGFFGIPLLSSFPATYTGRQVWQHFSLLMENKVKDPKDLNDVLRIEFLDNRKNPLEVFPVIPSKETEDEPVDELKTSFVAKDSDEPIIKFLGAKSSDSFLQICLEWSDVSFSDDENDNENNCRVDEDRFVDIRDDPSYVEAMEKLKKDGNTKKGVSLDECFQTFIKPERLDNRNMWYCSKCKDHVRAMKTMELWRLPDVLVVHLKRFEFRNVLRRDKLETFVDFPVDNFDMSRHCGSTQQSTFVNEHTPAIYDLFGVVNHYGRMGFGHYTAFCREWNELGEMSSWSLFDDSAVSSVVGNNVVSPAAYVLFYRRRPVT